MTPWLAWPAIMGARNKCGHDKKKSAGLLGEYKLLSHLSAIMY
jgi:hypothetical protein